MKIYTKTGDKGQTSLIGGTRVPKSHLRIEAYGTLDELNSWIGLLRDQEIPQSLVELLMEIQERLFTLGSHLASDPGKSKKKIPAFDESDITKLEAAIDRMNEQLPELKNFILPGGHTLVSWCHIARCVCRRAERCAVALSDTGPDAEFVIRYLNRLSDFLFVLARFCGLHSKAAETPWKPKI